MAAVERADFVVIGGGIAGAAAAYELAGHGRVALLEAEATCGHHTTGRSAAVFTEAYERDVVRLLAMASRGFLEAPPDGFAESPILSPLSILLIGRADQAARVKEEAELATGFVPSVRLLDGDAARRLCPVLRPGYADVALVEPHAHGIDVHTLHQGFLRGLRQRGGRVVTGFRVSTMVPEGGGWVVSNGTESVGCRAVVNAAGAWSDMVAAMAGAQRVGLVPHRRTAFTFGAPDSIDASELPMVIDVDEDFYVKPEGPQFLGSLAEETPMEPHDVRHEEIDVALAIERIEAATTLQVRHVRSAWAGLRTFAPDRLPVVGEDPVRPSFFWLAGQGGYGIMTSPAMARAASGLIVDGRLPADLAQRGITAEKLTPARFEARP
jgi:D-arginine dehydrogenase